MTTFDRSACKLRQNRALEVQRGVAVSTIVLCKTHFNSLALMRPRSHTNQLFAATASILLSTLPPLYHVDLKGYGVAVFSELGNYRCLHDVELCIFRDQ
jgi:hypothetical protein